MTFRGVYTYADAGRLDAALAEVRELIDDAESSDDKLFRDELLAKWDRALRRDGARLSVEVETYGPPFLYASYESVVEMLADGAESGTVKSTMEGSDEVGEYPAGSDES